MGCSIPPHLIESVVTVLQNVQYKLQYLLGALPVKCSCAGCVDW